MRPKSRLSLLLTVLIGLHVAASPCAEASRKRQIRTGRPADAMEVFRCDFDEVWDINYDDWPDRWTRKEGSAYPHYVAVEIVDDPSTISGRKLSIKVDGAQAHVMSPPIRVLPKFSYFLDLKVKIERAPHSRVFVRLDFMNSQGEVRQSLRSGEVPATGDWVTVPLGPERPQYDDIDRAVLHVETERGEKGDIYGEVSLSEIWMGRLPSLEVTANNRFHVYTDPKDVVITCSLSGIRERDPIIRFQLLDATSSELGLTGEKQLDGVAIAEDKLIRQESRRASDIVDGVGNHVTGYEGSEQWRPEIDKHGGYGFYQVRVKMLSSQQKDEDGNEKEIDRRKITLAVIPPPVAKIRGEFGWSLPFGDDPLDFASLEKLLPLVGVNWVKLPIWFPPEKSERGDAIIQFAERLSASDIETVGIIQHPDTMSPDYDPAAETEPLAQRDVANVFGGDPSRWMPLYDHIMSRLSLRIRWWQLGSDGDTSFVGYPDLIQQIRGIRKNLYRFGQDVGLGIGWRWDTPSFMSATSWEFQQMAANPPLDATQLDTTMASLQATARKRWVLIHTEAAKTETASQTQRTREHIARVRRFIEQIIVAKKHGADGVFLPNPFSGWHGVMTEEGKPGELLLPWRTTAMLLGGAEYLGQIQLPSGSQNWIFRRADGQVVMVVWNDNATAGPVEESLYLGAEVTHVDVWGKQTLVRKANGRDIVKVGQLPSFVLGLNESIARWRMAVRFDEVNIPSVFGQEHANTLHLINGFPQGVGGRVSLFVPDKLQLDINGRPKASDQWKITTSDDKFSAASGQALDIPLEVNLDGAAIGEQPVRIDFTIEAERADEQYRFSVWRSLNVGMGEIEIGVKTKIDQHGRLEIEQTMRNTGERTASFKCFLQPQSRRRKRAQVFELGPEPDRKLYTYSAGEELLGTELTLRAVEIDGPRVLIDRVIVTRGD